MRKTPATTAARPIHYPGSTSCTAFLAGLVVLWCIPSYAHHSYAEYDMEATQTVSGTLEKFDWIAPHADLKVTYLNEQGVVQEVSVTTGSPAVLARQGFQSKDFLPGSKVTMSWHPNRNGVFGGELAELKLEDGRVLYGHGGLASNPGGRRGGPPPGTGGTTR
jgi:hypothetical protein